jgi:hypothetical protein
MKIRVLVTIAAIGIAWWLFGFSTYREGPFVTRMYRRFGRVTRIDLSAWNGQTITRERILYPWSEPYEPGDPITSCAAIPPEVWQDWNSDGTWDTWLRRVGPDQRGDCSTEYQVDLTNDGRPDWKFISPYTGSEEARRQIVARRGF